MEQPTNDAGINGLLVTLTFWVFSHLTASDVATYCTIASALVTIFVNVNKYRNGKDKS
jgi:hypothetical protein